LVNVNSNAGDHEHQQHDDGEVQLGLVKYHFGRRQPQHDRFNREQSTRL
jgi:hypothetical protein